MSNVEFSYPIPNEKSWNIDVYFYFHDCKAFTQVHYVSYLHSMWTPNTKWAY